jgi:hypothetical protein
MPDRNGYIGRAPSDSAVTVSRQSYTASGVTTDFTFTSGYTPGYFDIYINGVKMIEGSDYTSSDGATFSILNGGAQDGDALEAVAYKAFNATTIDSAPGNLTVGTNLTVGGFISAGGTITGSAFYGDGSNLSNVISGVGINTAGGNVGYGVTLLDFRGAGVSTITAPVSGISTINITGGSGGGSIGTTGITTQTIFSNPNVINDDQLLNVPNHNYGMFGPVTVGAAITVGVGNTFVVV